MTSLEVNAGDRWVFMPDSHRGYELEVERLEPERDDYDSYHESVGRSLCVIALFPCHREGEKIVRLHDVEPDGHVVVNGFGCVDWYVDGTPSPPHACDREHLALFGLALAAAYDLAVVALWDPDEAFRRDAEARLSQAGVTGPAS